MEPSSNPYISPSASRGRGKSLRRGGFRLRLHRQLPKLCALCGEPAAVERRIAFSYGHRRDDQNVVVLMPFCHKHRSFQEQWPLLVWCIAGPLVIFAIGAAHTIFFDGHPMVLGVVLAVLIAIFVGVFAWLILESRRIRVSRLNVRDIVLVGLAPKFIRACEEMYDREAKPTEDFLDGLC